MKNSKEILQVIQPQLDAVERARKKMHYERTRKVLITILVVLGLALLILLLSAIFNIGSTDLIWFIVIVAAFLVFYFIQGGKLGQEKAIDQSIGEIILKTSYPDWKFQATRRLASQQFDYLNLFPNYSSITGQNLMEGTYGDTAFAFSYLELTKNSGKNKEYIFNGLLLLLDFHKDIRGRTLVFPDLAQNLLGTWLGKQFQFFGHKGLDLVYLEDPEFEKFYAVYSQDQIEARYILTPGMQQALTALRKKFNKDISFSFTNGRVGVAINDVEPYHNALDTPINADGTIYHFNRPIEMVTEIIDTLNLNTRIWAKA